MATFLFHLTMSCVHKYNKNMTTDDYTKATDTLTLLMLKHFTLLSPKGIVRDKSCQTEVIRMPSVFLHSSKDLWLLFVMIKCK